MEHYSGKVERLRQWICDLPKQYEYVVFMDGKDTFLQRPLTTLCQRYNEMGHKMVIGGERPCWPVLNDPEYNKLFPDHPHGMRFPNSGLWMGARAAIQTAMTYMVGISQQLRTAPLPDTVKQWKPWVKLAKDDQFLWQMVYLNRTPEMDLVIDYDSVLFGNASAPLTLRMSDNLNLYRKQAGDRYALEFGWNGVTPCTIHFPGPCSYAAPLWQSYLNLWE